MSFAKPQAVEPRRDVFAFWALVVFSVFIFVVPGSWFSQLEPFRLALVTAALAASLLAIRRLGRGESWTFDGVRGGALILFAVLVVLSAGWSVKPEATRSISFEILKLLAIYLTLVNVVTSPKRLRIVAQVLVLASIVTSIGVIHWYFRGQNLVEGFRARWVGVYADPNHMAMDIGIVIPLALALLVHTRSWLFKSLYGCAAILALTAVVLSHSRGGALGTSCALAVWAFRERSKVRTFALGTLIVLGLAIFAPKSFWDRTQTIGGFRSDASAMGRVHAWTTAARINQDHPFLGIGAGAFRYAWPTYAPVEARHALVAHNVFLDVLGELGFVGFLLFLTFVGGAAGGAFSASKDPDIGWLARGISAAIVGYVIADLFSGYIGSAHFYVLFGLGACAERIHRRLRNATEERAESILPGQAIAGS